MVGFLDEFKRISGAPYLLVVILAAISVASLAFSLTHANDQLDDQQTRMEAQLKLTNAAILAECHTRSIIEGLTGTTIALLKSQPRTPARLKTIRVFEGYLVVLMDNSDCERLRKFIEE